MRCLETGGAGFIGSNLVDILIDDGHTVIVIDDLSTGKEVNINPKAIFHKVDISESYLIRTGWYKTVMKGVDTVFHLAAKARVQPSIVNPLPYNDANVNGTLNMLMIAKNLSVKRFVYSASSSCYGDTEVVPTPETAPLDPMSPYALQKLIGEQYCRLFSKIYDLDTVCLRYFNVYGKRMAVDGAYSLVMAIFKEQVEANKPLTITNDGKQRRDFTHVSDVVEANILAAEYKGRLDGESFNIGNGYSYSINEVADIIGGEKKYGEKRLEPFETLAENSKAKEILGWKPMGDLEKYIKENY